MLNQVFIEKDFGNKSFLRLAWGKQHLLAHLTRVFPATPKVFRYIEPFVGGGSLFFSIAPSGARISDANHLIMDGHCEGCGAAGTSSARREIKQYP